MTLATPEPLRANLIHTPGAESWCSRSHDSHSSASPKARVGSSGAGVTARRLRRDLLEALVARLDAEQPEVAEDLRPRLDEAGATLEVFELPEVRGDARQLRRLLQNLVANAVKFRGERPPCVKVSAQAGHEGWVVSVEDNGVGIAAHDAARIFGMFARASGDHEGTGIGLAVCRRVVEAHAGQIWVEPANGGGSVFRFTLPQ